MRFALRTPDHAPAPPGRSALAFHRRLPGYEPTPLREAPNVAAELEVGEVWVKDESSRLGLPSFKILGASWGVYNALEAHVGGFEPWEEVEDLRTQLERHGPLALAAATDGNHGRAVARMARLLGLGAQIFVPAGTARARIEGIKSEGAICEVVPGAYEDAVRRSAEEASPTCLVISDTSWPGYEEVPGWVIDGYSTIFWEIEERLATDAGHEPDLVAIQLGVGALGAAAVRHFRARRKTPVMVGVEPAHAACILASVEAGEISSVPGPHDSIMAGLNCGTPSLIAWPAVGAGFDAYVAVDDEFARRAMRGLAADGIVAGETGGAGLAGLLALCDAGRSADVHLNSASKVLLICTEGATDPIEYRNIVGPFAGKAVDGTGQTQDA